MYATASSRIARTSDDLPSRRSAKISSDHRAFSALNNPLRYSSRYSSEKAAHSNAKCTVPAWYCKRAYSSLIASKSRYNNFPLLRRQSEDDGGRKIKEIEKTSEEEEIVRLCYLDSKLPSLTERQEAMDFSKTARLFRYKARSGYCDFPDRRISIPF